MPVISSALRHSKHKGWKPSTRDKRKVQSEFQHEPGLLDLAHDLSHRMRQSLDDLVKMTSDDAVNFDPEEFTDD